MSCRRDELFGVLMEKEVDSLGDKVVDFMGPKRSSASHHKALKMLRLLVDTNQRLMRQQCHTLKRLNLINAFPQPSHNLRPYGARPSQQSLAGLSVSNKLSSTPPAHARGLKPDG